MGFELNRIRASLLLFSLALSTAACNDLLEALWPTKSEEQRHQERMAGDSSYFRAKTKTVYTDEKGVYYHPLLESPRIDPDRPAHITEALESMFQAYFAGDLDRTIELARKVLSERPEDMDALITLVRTHARKGDHGALLPEIKKRAEGPPPSAAYLVAQARLLMEMGKPEEGLACLDRARALDPDFTDVHFMYGRYFADYAPRLDLARAETEYRRAAQSAENPGALYNLGVMYFHRLRDPCMAADALTEYARVNSLPIIQCRLVTKALLKCGRRQEGLAQFEECKQKALPYWGEYSDLGMALLDARMYEEARDHYGEGVERYRTSLRGEPGAAFYSKLGRAQERTGDLEGAIRTLNRSLRLSDYGWAHYHKARALLGLGRNQDALAEFQRAADTDPGITTARTFLRKLENDPGHRFSPEEITTIYQWHRAATPADRLAKAGNGRVDYEMFEAAEEKFASALALEPDNGFAWAGKIYLEQRRGNLNKAIEIGREALSLGVDHAWVYNNLGYVMKMNGDRDGALEMYLQACERLPQDPTIQVNTALLLEELKRDGEARDHWYLAGVDLAFNPLGPYKNHAFVVVGLLVLAMIVIRVRRGRSKRDEPPRNA